MAISQGPWKNISRTRRVSDVVLAGTMFPTDPGAPPRTGILLEEKTELPHNGEKAILLYKVSPRRRTENGGDLFLPEKYSQYNFGA